MDEGSAFRVGRYSAEERKQRIHRYRSKRTQRNFNKTIKVSLKLSSIKVLFDFIFGIGTLHVTIYNAKNLPLQYACRKTLADSRPRVRGRFARNDETEETNKATISQREDYEEDLWVRTKGRLK